MFGSLFKAAVGVAITPITIAADVVTLGGALTDREEPYTVSNAEEIMNNLEKAVSSEEDWGV